MIETWRDNTGRGDLGISRVFGRLCPQEMGWGAKWRRRRCMREKKWRRRPVDVEKVSGRKWHSVHYWMAPQSQLFPSLRPASDFIQRDFSIVVHLIRRWLHIWNTNTNTKLLMHWIGWHGIQNTNTNTKLLMHLINSWMLARLTHQGKVERWRRENLLRLMFRPSWFSPCLTLFRVKIVFKQSDPV